MAVTYSTAVKTTRMQAVVDAIATSGKLEICDTAYAHVLATIPLANPAGVVAGAVLTFTMPQSDASADYGLPTTAVIARIRTGANADVITGLTVGTSGADIILNSTSITAGQAVTINSATITHG